MRKKAQNEIVGFILIVVIVVIIGLFLVIFYIKQEPVEQKSKTVENFLQASMLYTTDCILSIEPINLRTLMKKCYDGMSCLDGRESCGVLNDTLTKIVKEGWAVGEDSPENAYFIEIYYEEGEDEDKFERKMLSISEGNCTGSRKGAEYFLDHSPGTIVVEMKLCYT